MRNHFFMLPFFAGGDGGLGQGTVLCPKMVGQRTVPCPKMGLITPSKCTFKFNHLILDVMGMRNFAFIPWQQLPISLFPKIGNSYAVSLSGSRKADVFVQRICYNKGKQFTYGRG